MDTLQGKLQSLRSWFKQRGRVAIAYSGGVDSSFLLAVGSEAIGKEVLAVIGRSPTYPEREHKDALALAAKLGANVVEVETDELSNPAFSTNPPTRCFACKSTLMTKIWEVARTTGIDCVAEGSNADDVGDFRPGMDAARALGVDSPLMDHGFSKQEIRDLSKEMNLPTWNKPAFACLSSRIPYGETISVERLGRIEMAENALRELGLVQYRVRDHGDLARVELLPGDIEGAASEQKRKIIAQRLKNAGYKYVCLDLEGYRMGAMNEALSEKAKVAARETGK